MPNQQEHEQDGRDGEGPRNIITLSLSDASMRVALATVSGWIGALNMAPAPPAYDPRLDMLVTFTQRIFELSNSAAEAIAALTAKVASIDDQFPGVRTDLTDTLAAFKAQGAAPIDFSGIDAATASLGTFQTGLTEMSAELAAAKAAAPPPPPPSETQPAHTAQDTTDQTANGIAREDGTIRNNFFLPEFDGTKPETT